MQATLHKRHKIVIILLSLLINLLLIFPLILMRLDLTSEDAFVIFDQEPESDPEQNQDATHTAYQEPEELIEHILSSGAVPVQSDQEVQQDMEAQPNPMATQATPGDQLDQEIDQETASEQEEVPEEHEREIDTIAEEKPEPAAIEKKIEIEEIILHDTAELPDTKKEEKQAEEVATEEEEKESITQKPKPQATQPFGVSLGQIAQGFIKSMQQEEGLNNPQMDADKLVAHQYATKVWNIIKNSFKADANMLHLSQSVDTMAYLVITLTKHGQLVNIHLEANNTNHAFRQIESLITTHAKKAGLFPPLPKRFNVAQKTFTFPIQIQGQEGYHSYRLSYGKT